MASLRRAHPFRAAGHPARGLDIQGREYGGVRDEQSALVKTASRIIRR